MTDFSINRLNATQGLQSLGASQARQNTQKSDSLLGKSGGDSVSFSANARLGNSSSSVADIVSNVGKLSLGEAKAQLNPSTVFGLGLF